MNIKQLKIEVCNANIKLNDSNLVILTWGNVSGIDRKQNVVVIKPSGVPYKKLTPKMMCVVDLYTGKIIGNNRLNPSSDTPTHLALYRKYKDIGGIVHTHSTFATAYAQAGCDLQTFGTTHADYFCGNVCCTRNMTEKEVSNNYEWNTGQLIIETLTKYKKTALNTKAILVNNHGPFTWDINPQKAVENAIVLEQVCKMNIFSLLLNKNLKQISIYLLNKHYFRKHGPKAYYGQKKK